MDFKGGNMNFKFRNKKISGILTVVPKNLVKFEDEIDNYGFSKEKSMKLKEVLGFDERRIVKGDICTSDMALFGLEHLISEGLLKTEDINALIFMTQTPDYFMPPTSAVLHGKLNLSQEVLCFDINHGCTAYLYGLLQSFLLLEQSGINKVVLINGDTLSRAASPHDRNIWPMIGDACSISILEYTDDVNELFMNLRMDGSRHEFLIIPAGAFRKMSSEETRELKLFPDGNKRSEEHLFMNGAAIFNFSLTDVPSAINDLFQFAELSIDQIDYFMMHQPNRFILNKLARKLGVPQEKMPSNIVEKFGSQSGASIPLTIVYNIRDLIKENILKLCMASFGVGLSWGTLIMETGPLDFCELLEI